MAYWRMQLHPEDSANSVRHTVSSLAAEVIGLDFRNDVGDLRNPENRAAVTGRQDGYCRILSEMKEGDAVLVVTHHWPFALCCIDGPYEFCETPSDLGVWFRHFRRVKDIRFWADRPNNPPKAWPETKLSRALEQLKTEDTDVYRFVERWLAEG